MPHDQRDSGRPLARHPGRASIVACEDWSRPWRSIEGRGDRAPDRRASERCGCRPFRQGTRPTQTIDRTSQRTQLATQNPEDRLENASGARRSSPAPLVVLVGGLLALGPFSASCEGSVGVIAVDLVADPSGDLLSRTQRVRARLDNPAKEVEAVRNSSGGLVLDLEVDALGSIGSLSIEAFDASNALIGVGRSPPLPISAIDGVLTIHLSAPLSMSTAVVALDPVRADFGLAPLSFGGVFFGGSDGSGNPTAAVSVFNVYDHDFQIGLELPAPRSGAAAFRGNGGRVYLFGGRDGSANALANALRFDTNVAPAGAYFTIPTASELARAGAPAATLGGDRGIIGGGVPVLIDGIGQTTNEIAGGVTLSGTLTSSGTGAIAVGAGTASSGAARVLPTGATELAVSPSAMRTGHSAVSIAGDDVLVLGGEIGGTVQTSGLHFVAANSTFTEIDNLLTTGRTEAAVAATERYIVVAGGLDQTGEVLGSVEVLDAQTLSVVATATLAVPRHSATALALANGQVLVIGGRDAAGQPIGALELFTPNL